MPYHFRNTNGRFAKRNVADKKLKALTSMSKAKKKRGETVRKESNACEGRRIVELKELGKNLKCCKCSEVLSLERITDEKRLGLHSVLTVACHKCETITSVRTGKVKNSDGRNSDDINETVVFGAVHAGISCAALNQLLASLDIPDISNDLYKRYEPVIGLTIQEAEENGCKQATEGMPRLVVKSIQKLCEELSENKQKIE
ncbi:uncharacterized protein LOC128881669 [Hylaeus volcanicus]|uniref:uncharacterized protein LOC128881669 n=1 Tax=Hylaeus volcanicus TaxID=313075 RepID=UPI0023B81040|nr:uncharacterized protein LOC128881669 [Hylaeus volcanicus]